MKGRLFIPVFIGGGAATGKSTVAKQLAERLEVRHYSAGDRFRQLASERGLTLAELRRAAEKDTDIDREIDRRLLDLAESEVCVIDGRVLAYLAKNVRGNRIFAVQLTASRDVAAKRLSTRERRMTPTEARDAIQYREEEDARRFKALYHYDLADTSCFDCRIDTDDLGPDMVIERIIKALPF